MKNMSKIEKDVARILEIEGISQDFIEEIIVKSPENVIVSLNFDKIDLNKEEIEKIVENSSKKLKNELNFEKVTIFLTSNKGSKKTSNKNSNKNSAQQKVNKRINKKAQKDQQDKKQKTTKKSILKQIFSSFLNNKNKSDSEDKSKKSQSDIKSAQKSVPKASQKNQGEKDSEKSSKSAVSEVKPVIGVKKIIAVASAKGGVGKSTFAVNLALSLKRIGHKVAIVDADIYGPSIPTLLGLKGKPEVENGLLIPPKAFGLKAISIGMMIDDNAAGVWRGPMITKILYQLIRSVDWKNDDEEVDIMIIDMPPGTGDVYLSLAQNFPLDGVVAVSTPQNIAVKDVIRSLDCFEKLKIKILGLVQNMAYLKIGDEKKYIFGRDNAKIMAEASKIKFLGDIEIDQKISDANEDSKPIVVKDPSSEISMVYGQIAESVLDELKD